ncbi:MAG: hydrogenase expression/formation protein HypE [Candidatus Omnitrophota bacterium]
MDNKRITLAHGNGGQKMQKLITELIISNFGNPILDRMDDSAVFGLSQDAGRIAFTTDSFVVTPIFFPGGDIGKLAICGTVNDLAVMGAKPQFLSVGFILEEGLEISIFKKIIISMRKAAKEAQVKIVCGDTKVVNKNKCDRIFINTAGIGMVPPGVNVSSKFAKAKDVIIVSGTVAEHGIAILAQREGIKFNSVLSSDCASLNALVSVMLKYAKAIRVMRDPTRGGLAAALNEIAASSNVGIEIDEQNVPLKANVKGACEILGLDPLYLPSEGRLLAFVRPDKAKPILKRMRQHLLGRGARIIGKVVNSHKKHVYLNTVSGSSRILDMPVEEQLPRIC